MRYGVGREAHMEYLAHIYAERTPKGYVRAKQGLQRDLRNRRRWSILVDGFVADDSNTVPGLGLGFLLLCGPVTARKYHLPVWYGEVLSRGELDVMLETSNPPLVGNQVTAWGSSSMAAFLLDIGWSERPLRSNLGAGPVILKGRIIRVDLAQNLQEACLVIKN